MGRFPIDRHLKTTVIVKNSMLSLFRKVRIVLLAVSLAWLSPQYSCAQGTPVESSVATSLQDRIVALTQLIHLRFHSDESSLNQHRSEVESVLADWNAIARHSSADQQQMTAWLDVAIRSLMPGRNGRLPRPPYFGGTIVQHPTAVQHPTTIFEYPTIEIPATDIPVRRQTQVIEPMADTVKPHSHPSTSPRRSKWSRHPSAAPLKWSDPFADEPQSNTNPFRQRSDRYETRRPIFGDSKGITVDLAELSAEVRGYNVALRGLSQRLAQKREISTTTLTAIAAELERLETERRFLDLYREGLSKAEQKSLPTSPSAELVYEVVRRKTAVRLSKTPRGQNEERRTLEGLAARLARL